MQFFPGLHGVIGQVPDGPAHPHRGIVPQKPADFPHDHGHTVGGKTHLEGGVKVVDGLDQTDAPHLKQVIQIFAPAGKLLHHAENQAQVALDHLLAGRRIAAAGCQQKFGFLPFVQHRQLRSVHPADLNFSCVHFSQSSLLRLYNSMGSLAKRQTGGRVGKICTPHCHTA